MNPPRLGRIERSDLDAAAQSIWDAMAGSRGDLRGPYQILIRCPELAHRFSTVVEAFRAPAAGLTEADRELATLATGLACASEHVWRRHESVARRAGVRDEAIEALAGDDGLVNLDPRERTIVEAARRLTREHRLDGELYARAVAAFGEEALVELVALVGFYSLLAMVVGSFGIPG